MSSPAVTYLGRSEWMVDGHRGDWAASYHRLIREHGMFHSQAVHELVECVRLDRPRWAQSPVAPQRVEGGPPR